MTYSWDELADALTGQVSAAAVQEVLTLAGVSERSRFTHDWRRAYMTPMDLALVWEALVEGRLLGETLTRELLELAETPEIPASLETFPAALALPGYRFGQKAGYYVSDGLPYFLVGAGYLVASDPAGPRFTMVLMIESRRADLNDPQRRSVLSLVVGYVLADAP
jgi:hypothetical protein